jgi:exodeoxyribonuclease-3
VRLLYEESEMRIVIWNCNMALHDKYEHLLALAPDIAVIPECANVDLIRRNAPDFVPSSSIWIGDNRHKGLGVFTFGAYRAEQSAIYQSRFPHVSPVRIDGPTQFNLLAVWACHAHANSYEARQGPLMRAMSEYREFIQDCPTIVAGVFNDNVLWDKPKKLNNHGTNVDALTAFGLSSAYHHSRGVRQGSEQEPTIYWRNRKIDGPRYHIDYCFVPDRWINEGLAVEVGHFQDWVGIGLSDHVPLVVDINSRFPDPDDRRQGI